MPSWRASGWSGRLVCAPGRRLSSHREPFLAACVRGRDSYGQLERATQVASGGNKRKKQNKTKQNITAKQKKKHVLLQWVAWTHRQWVLLFVEYVQRAVWVSTGTQSEKRSSWGKHCLIFCTYSDTATGSVFSEHSLKIYNRPNDWFVLLEKNVLTSFGKLFFIICFIFILCTVVVFFLFQRRHQKYINQKNQDTNGTGWSDKQHEQSGCVLTISHPKWFGFVYFLQGHYLVLKEQFVSGQKTNKKKNIYIS